MEQAEGTVRRARWAPPSRPEWLARLNAEGAAMDLRSVVPLDVASLISSARENTGLTDFGPDDGWYERLQVLVRSFDDEARLTLAGRLMTRSDLVLALQALLQIEATYAAHPEIEDEEINRILLIVGQGRSGTTALQHLLAEDPDNGTVRHWEALFPCPPPTAQTYRSDPRIARSEGMITQWNRAVPELESMHEFNGWSPTESSHVHSLAFRSVAWADSMQGQCPGFAAYLAGQDPADMYRFEKRVLKLLQWRNPRRTWIMKSPITLAHLPSVLEVYPDIGFIWPHRDPIRALSSTVDLLGTLYYVRSDEPYLGGTFDLVTDPALAAGLMAQPITWLEAGILPREQLCNVQYQDFVRDPMGVVRTIYSAFGMELTDRGAAAMQRHVEEHPRSNRPAHEYDVGSAAEIAVEREGFMPYQKYFDVPDEI